MRRLVMALITGALLVVASPAVAEGRGSRLTAFDTCSALVDYALAGAERPAMPMRAAGPPDTGLTPRAPLAKPVPGAVGTITAGSSASAAADSRAAAPETPVAGQDFSATNNQELGIEEPDVVQTDGRRMFLVAGTALWAFDVTGTGAPKVLGKVDLQRRGGELLLRGNRVLVIQAPDASPVPINGFAVASRAQVASEPSVTPILSVPDDISTRLVEVDVTDPAAMQVRRSMTVPGYSVTARMTGGTVRVVLDTPAVLPATTGPIASRAARASASTRSASTRAPRTSPGDAGPLTVKTPRRRLSAFIPRTTLRSRVTGRTYRRNLVPCTHVRHPHAFSGLDLLTVLTVDFDRGLFNVDRDAVMAGAQVVYASDSSLYVASTKAVRLDDATDVSPRTVTEIHRFDASQRGETTYTSSGTVPGFVLNRYALSEHGGDLRVASTTDPIWLGDAENEPSQSQITVLRRSGSRLEQIGQVGGLGKTERIYAARFIGDTAYLVTFRQVDPLYTVDLRDPEHPTLVGELKIPGYSSYLHPIGDDLLLGIGMGPSAGSGAGGEVSIFDVRDPAKPTRLAAAPLPGTSAAEFDPHAFLWWAKANLAILPVADWSTTGGMSQSAIGFTATRGAGLSKAGQITHGPEWDHPAIVRTVVVGDRILAISDLGISSSALTGFTPDGFTSLVSGG